jgi:hypothetical protein
VGIDPRPFTVFQLATMAKARGISEWNHTASVLAMLHNTTLGRRGAAKTPRHYHPFLHEEKRLTRDESARTLNELVGVRLRSAPNSQ